MADEMNNADILSMLNSAKNPTQEQNRLLASIDKSLKKIAGNSPNMSMSSARDRYQDNQDLLRNTPFKSDFFNRRKHSSKGAGNFVSDFTDALEEELFNEIFGKGFKSSLRNVRDRLVRDIGVSFEEIPTKLGQAAGQSIMRSFKNSGLDKALLDPLKSGLRSKLQTAQKAYIDGIEKYMQTIGGVADYKYKGTFVDADGSLADLFSKLDTKPDVKNTGAVGGYEKNEMKITKMSEAEVPTFSLDSIADTFFETADLSDAVSDISDVSTSIIDTISSTVDGFDISIVDAGKALGSAVDWFTAGSTAMGSVGAEAAATITAGAGMMTEGAVGAGAALSGLASVGGSVLAAFGTAIVPIGATILAIEVLDDNFDDLKRSVSMMSDAMKESAKASKRYSTSREKNLDLAQRRLEADVRTLVETPFKILNDAASAWYDTWDHNLRTINATQGYTKTELQTLLASFADRLREENLSDVISAADITTNLAKVLDSGLSGTIAEEFAYLATKLNAAVPTQDFFGYADVYASIAANAVNQGMTNSEAIAYANSQLEQFAGNILYASREISGGFTTGLKDAQSLFKQSAQIAQASKTNNAAGIGGVMAAVSAVVGAIAPDLATSMTDVIYKAAVGGNASEIVALRSLAGINASNTEFLKQLASNPQTVFANLFTELGKRQNMSNDAFMEVAEGLADVFGVSMDAFARIDFNYLASAISQMNTTNSALSENMALLVSGETTTNAEMLKMQQINKYIIDEGLAYVLDNEAARAIQEHMWDEQRDRDLMENTYGVEIQGAALKFLEGLANTVDNILGFINPFKILSKGVDLIATVAEATNRDDQIEELLELGKVGAGQTQDKTNLLTRNQDLNLTSTLNELMGGTNTGKKWTAARDLMHEWGNPFTSMLDDRYDSTMAISKHIDQISIAADKAFSGSSAYNWGIVGKSIAKAVFETPAPTTSTYTSSAGSSYLEASKATAEAQTKSLQNMQAMLDSMQDFVQADATASYKDWVATAKDYGIADFEKSLTDVGLTAESVRGQFDMLQTQIAVLDKQKREETEEEFWVDSVEMMKQIDSNVTDANSMLGSIFSTLEKSVDLTSKIHSVFTTFLAEWEDYFINHTVYNSAYSSATVDQIMRNERESSESAIYALADALTENDVKLLLDPTVQTNALLAQILKVANAILNQNSTGAGGVSLPDTIAGLSLGIVG